MPSHSLENIDPPLPGKAIQVAPGILWARLALPLILDHVNIYFLADDDGWTIVDAGFNNAATRDAWEALLTGPLAGKPVRRLIITHHHPDHVGAAGWLLGRTGAQLVMTREEFLMSLYRCRGQHEATSGEEVAFFRQHGVSPKVLEQIAERDQFFRRAVAALPAQVDVLCAGDEITLAGRSWQVVIGRGHSPAQLLFSCPADNLFIAADQVIGTITPNIPASFMEPYGDPLQDFLDSLAALKGQVASDSLVLPGHKLPFVGPHKRIDALVTHHQETLDKIARLIHQRPQQVNDLITALFRPGLTSGGISLAAAEVLAHMMSLFQQGRAHPQADPNGQVFWRSIS